MLMPRSTEDFVDENAQAIAVIGLAGRFPGAVDTDQFWGNLRVGIESVTELDDERLRHNGAEPALIEADDFVRSVVLLDRVEEFDAGFFGYNARDAAILDPQHRLFLECAWHAMEDAGCVPGADDDCSVGVYAGSSLSSYLISNLLRGRALDPSPDGFGLLIANDKDYLASRVSYKLDLKGPAISVQTACSSSLVAVHLATGALLSYDCDIALAGGVTVRVPQGCGYRYQEGSILSSDGHCRPFDARANGTTFGSGAGVVVLKRLADALADNDRIDAVLLGSAVNNDGADKVGYTAPSVPGQAKVIATALEMAGVAPAEIDAVEAHGTGTPLGDPIEVAALTAVFGDGADRADPCLLSSVKSNIGHLDSAAGVASFIKAVLQLRHGELVPNVNFTEPNPEIDFARTSFRVATTTSDWPRGERVRLIGVSSFGFGGTNAHAVLREGPARPAVGEPRPVHVLALSARSKEALDEHTDALAGALGDGAVGDLADAARTLQTGRRPFRYRRVAVVTDEGGPQGAATVLTERDPDRVFSRRAAGDPVLCWLFPGQGSQYPGMGAGLYHAESTYRRVVDECAELLLPSLGRDLREVLQALEGADPDTAAKELRQTVYAQPALFVVQTALAMLLRGWGIEPTAMLGHSVGEITAAYLAGVFDLPDALRLVATRGRLMQEQPTGRMSTVACTEDQLRESLPPELSVAAINAPRLCVISGPDREMTAFLDKLAARKIDARPLHTSHAFHSAMMGPVAAPLAELIGGMRLHEPRIPYVANRSGAFVTAEQATDPRYWAGQLLAPVRFADGVAALTGTAEAGEPVILLEVGPGHTLTSLAKVCPEGRHTVTATTLRAANETTEDEIAVATALGKLWLSGVDICWPSVDGHAARRRLKLPGYPFQRRRYWVDAAPNGQHSAGLIMDVPADPGEQGDDAGAGLPAGYDPRPELDTAFVEPRDDLERRVAAIWSELLGVHPVGTHDAFLELGGHSLMAINVVRRITAELGVTIPLRRLVRAGTVAKVAELANEMGVGPVREDVTADGLPKAVPEPEHLHEPFPLTEIQQAQWIGRQGNFQLGNVAAHIYFEVDADDLDIDRLQAAWSVVEDRHPMLHAVVTSDGQQLILSDVGPYTCPVVDLRQADQQRIDAELAELRDRLSDEKRPTDTWPLFDVILVQLPSRRTRVLLSFDLLIADIASIRILLRDWSKAYTDADLRLEPLELSYRDYVIATRTMREGTLYERSLEYWRRRVIELPPPPQLPLAKNPAEITRPRFVPRSRVLEQRTWQRLTEQGVRYGLTPSTILLAAYGVVLASWCREGQLTLNVTVINRFPVHPDVEELVGEFASFDLLPVDLTTSATFAEVATALQEQSWEDLEYRYVNGVEILRELARARGGTAGGVMPVVFTSTLVQQTESEDGSLFGWLGEVVYEAVQTPQVWVDAAAMQVPEGLYLSWPGVEELFPDGLLESMLDAYLTLLIELADAQELWERTPRTLRPAGEAELCERTNSSGGSVPDGLLCDRLLECALARPDDLAIVSAHRELSFGELLGRGVEIARRLAGRGLGRRSVVGIGISKGWRQVVAAVGASLAGLAFVPVDLDWPAARREWVLRDAGADCVLADTDTHADGDPEASVQWPGMDVVGVSENDEWTGVEIERWECPSDPGDVAYVIYTSGSTGTPKGVAVSHRAALNTLVDIRDRFDLTAADRVLGLSSLSFDLSIFDVFGVLGSGGALVLPEPHARRDPGKWVELIREHRVTVWNSVPALAQMMVDHLGGAGAGGADGLELRLVLVSGDWVPLGLADQLRQVCAPGVRVVSLGGATEAAIWSIFYDIEQIDPSWESVPYGWPLTNQRWYVFNDRWQECPVGVTGELFIAGTGLAEGYYRNPDRTEERFVHHPDTGERLYRTGDLGRRWANGCLEFLGREDFQVKIGGYRIELAEIEAALARHSDVHQAVVTTTGDRHQQRLAAYLVPADPDDDELVERVGVFLRQQVPAYMIPACYHLLASFPLTHNGKVDRAALFTRTSTATRSDANPRRGEPDPVTIRLVQIVTEVVGVAEVNPGRSFMEIGDSITAVQIVTRANAEGIDLTLRDLFEQPTIEQSADAVRARQSDGAVDGGAGPIPLTDHQLADRNGGTQWLELAIGRKLNTALAGRTVEFLLDRHPALRLRLVEIGESWHQVIAEPAPDSAYVPRMDLVSLPEHRRQKAFEAMLGEMAEELDPTCGPAAKAALFDLGPEDTRFVWFAHTMAVDDRSWDVLGAETQQVLADLQADLQLSLPLATTPFPVWAQAVAGEAPARAVTWPAQRAEEHGGPVARACAALTATETTHLVEAAATAYRMTLDEVCFAAVAEVSAPESVTVERDGRADVAHLDTSHSVGPFTVGGTVTWEAAGHTGEGQLGALLSAAKSAYREVGPFCGEHPSLVVFRAPGSRSIRPRPAPPPLSGAVATVCTVDGQLTVEWCCGDGREPGTFAHATAMVLRRIAEHCDTTEAGVVGRGDFPLAGLDDDELTAVLDAVQDGAW